MHVLAGSHTDAHGHQDTLRTRGFVSAHGDGRPPFVRAGSAGDAETCGIDFGALVGDGDDEYDPNEESDDDESDDDNDDSERKEAPPLE